MDPRTNNQVRAKPQSKKFCFPFAGTWSKENKTNLRLAFREIIHGIVDFSEAGGVEVDGVTIPFGYYYGVDKKAEWAGWVKGLGSGLGGNSKWCDPKTPVLTLLRALGMPFGCGCGKPDCDHWKWDPVCVKQKRDSLLADVIQKTGNPTPMVKVLPILPLERRRRRRIQGERITPPPLLSRA